MLFASMRLIGIPQMLGAVVSFMEGVHVELGAQRAVLERLETALSTSLGDLAAAVTTGAWPVPGAGPASGERAGGGFDGGDAAAAAKSAAALGQGRGAAFSSSSRRPWWRCLWRASSLLSPLAEDPASVRAGAESAAVGKRFHRVGYSTRLSRAEELALGMSASALAGAVLGVLLMAAFGGGSGDGRAGGDSGLA
jgi:hypothetical protein